MIQSEGGRGALPNACNRSQGETITPTVPLSGRQMSPPCRSPPARVEEVLLPLDCPRVAGLLLVTYRQNALQEESYEERSRPPRGLPLQLEFPLQRPAQNGKKDETQSDQGEAV